MEEQNSIAALLKIPIEKVINFSDHFEIIYANQNIGSLPYIVFANQNKYDTGEEVLNKLRWNYVYEQNMNKINQLIFDLLKKDEDEIEISIGGFRNLYVRDSKGKLICGITCSYNNNEWAVEKT
jgi:hypothetical protein